MRNSIFSVVTVVAVAFALVAGAGAFSAAKAAPYTDGERGFSLPAGEVNFFGADLADNSPIAVAGDRDKDSKDSWSTPDVYGLHGTLRP